MNVFLNFKIAEKKTAYEEVLKCLEMIVEKGTP